MSARAGCAWAESEDRIKMCGAGLEVDFVQIGELWTHAILLAREDGLELARAVESDLKRDDATRIVSPVYEQIQRHVTAAGPGLCLLSTGRLFQHNFSAAFSLLTDPDRPRATVLDVDVADRCRAYVESLAATYTVRLDSSSLADAHPQAITWEQVGRTAGCLELFAHADSKLVLAEAGPNATRVQVLAAVHPGSFTHRLRYRWRWTSNSGFTR